MNKLFSKIVSVVTAAAVTVFVSSSSLQTFVNELKVNAAETDIIYGDVNGDSIVNVFDLSMIKQEINSPGSSDIILPRSHRRTRPHGPRYMDMYRLPGRA